MNDLLRGLEGKKTYLAALGLAGLAAFKWSVGDTPGAMNCAMQALAAFGLRSALAKHLPTTAPVPDPAQVAKQ